MNRRSSLCTIATEPCGSSSTTTTTCSTFQLIFTHRRRSYCWRPTFQPTCGLASQRCSTPCDPERDFSPTRNSRRPCTATLHALGAGSHSEPPSLPAGPPDTSSSSGSNSTDPLSHTTGTNALHLQPNLQARSCRELRDVHDEIINHTGPVSKTHRPVSSRLVSHNAVDRWWFIGNERTHVCQRSDVGRTEAMQSETMV